MIEPGAKLPANLRFHRWPTNRGWTRDSGPIFVRDGSGNVAITNWRFNAWAKYRNWQLDDQLPARIARLLRLTMFEPEFAAGRNKRHVVLEGGSIDVNGRGLLLTTEECLLSQTQQRNPGMSREDIERVLDRFLGAKKVVWLERGIAGDDTHGHVDDIARFVAPNTVIAAVEPDPADANHEPLRENLKRLRKTIGTARPAAAGCAAAHACAGRDPWTTRAGQLRQFLHLQRNRPGSHLQSAERPACAQHPGSRDAEAHDHTDLLWRSDLGTGRHPLHDAAAARVNTPAMSKTDIAGDPAYTPATTAKRRRALVPQALLHSPAMDDKADELWMEEALRLAQRSAAAEEVPVGAVIVRDGVSHWTRMEPDDCRLRPDGTRRDDCPPRSRRPRRELSPPRLRSLRHAGALRHVRGSAGACAHSPAYLRGARP